jgi:hypothetical protein
MYAKRTRMGAMPQIDRDGVAIHYEVHGNGPPLLCGRHRRYAPAASDYVAAKILDGQKVVVPSAGHAVNIDQPQAFVDVMVPFLKDLSQEAGRERT